MSISKPELLSNDAGQSAARIVNEMSRLGYMSRAIHVAAEIGVADHMTDQTVAVEILAEKTGTHGATLKRLLRFLSSYGIFEEPAPGEFRNTELSATLRDDHPQSIRAIMQRVTSHWWNAFGDLEHSIRTGDSAFEHVHGMPYFEFLKNHPDLQRRFDKSMARTSDSDDSAIAAAYDFSRFRRIVDVGGGRGGLLVEILRLAPDATGILYDQPQVVALASRLDDADLSDRTEKTAGNFFETVPGGADCYVIKGVLHDFDDDQCVTILSNCRSAMEADGRVLIANLDLPATIDGPNLNVVMDIQMMALLGGRERSTPEWSELFGRSGLKLVDAFGTGTGLTLTEAMRD